jgi:hypothetical protein
MSVITATHPHVIYASKKNSSVPAFIQNITTYVEAAINPANAAPKLLVKEIYELKNDIL